MGSTPIATGSGASLLAPGREGVDRGGRDPHALWFCRARPGIRLLEIIIFFGIAVFIAVRFVRDWRQER